MNQMKKLSLFVAMATTAACADAEPGRTVSSDPFCQQVTPAVDAWLAEVRASHPTPSDDRYGGTAIVGANAELSGGMNGATQAGTNAVQHQQFVNMMTLIRYDEDLGPAPYLAESFEVAEDGTSVTFRLRQDVYWHDGERTDARDVEFTYLAVTDPLTAFQNSAFWDHYVTGPEGVEVLDDFTVRIRMRPHAMPLDPFRTVAILPEHLLRDVPRNELQQHPFGTQCPVGNGPFVFWSHVVDDRWTFVANPAFPEELGGRPYLDRYVYRAIPEQATLLAELLTGGIDVYIQPTPEQAQQILDSERLELLRYLSRSYHYVGWNARLPKLSDRRVRTAIGMALDREGLVNGALGGYGEVANSGVAPFHYAFDPALESPVRYDPEGARALFEEAGWRDRDGDGVRENPDGERLDIEIKYPPGRLSEDIATIMQAQLAEVGVAITIQSVEFRTLVGQLQAPERPFEGVIMGWRAEFRLDDTDLFHSGRADQPFAFTGTDNPEIDRLLELLSATVDLEEARGLWVEYQRALMEEQPYTYIYFRDQLAGVSRRLGGVEMDVRGEFLNVKDWFVDPGAS